MRFTNSEPSQPLTSNRALVLAVVLVLSITLKSAPAAALQVQPHTEKTSPVGDEKKQGGNVNSNAQPASTVIAPNPTADAGKPTTPPSDENIEIQRQLAKFTKYLVVVGAIVGGLQVVVLLVQTLYTGRAANAAKKSAETTENVLKMTERAHLTVGHWRVLQLAADTEGALECIISNFGRTRAKITGSAFEINMSSAPPQIRNVWQFEARQVVLGAGEPFKQRIRIGLISAAQFNEIQTGASTLWCQGCVNYEDIFEKPHITMFTVKYEAATNTFFVEQQPGFNVGN
jgi:hypothetical protein